MFVVSVCIVLVFYRETEPIHTHTHNTHKSVCIHINVCVYVYKNKEFAQLIMEADKSQNLHLANLRPRKADGVAQRPAGWKSRKLKSKVGRKSVSQAKANQAGRVLPYSVVVSLLFSSGLQRIA